ncbi:MAG: family 43 glycosylhydrolase [Bacteroidota bacterium]
MRFFLYLFLLLMFYACTAEERAVAMVTISNTQARTTIEGEIVDAHDGRIIQFEDVFYWYGTQYGNTNGFTSANAYHIYRSTDLVKWEHLGPALVDPPAGVYYRPHVIYHEASGQYVLWYNWYPELWEGYFGVAVSDRPEGPFSIVNTKVEVANSALGVGDFGLFVDEDQTAYISYNTINGHRVSVEKLTVDYLGSTLENGGYIAQYCEAGSMFKRRGIYYLLTDYTCCFCNQGAGARVYLSDHPLGEWTLTNNINRLPGQRALTLTDGQSFSTEYVALHRKADSTFQSLIIEKAPSNLIKLDLFTGDRQGQCGEQHNPQVHERIVLPQFSLEVYDHGWQTVEGLDATAYSSNMLEHISISFPKGESSLIRLTPPATYPYDEVRLTEVPGENINGVYISDGGPGPIIIPAQQTYVMDLINAKGDTSYIWMGDMWGSASDNIKGHDFQYWSSPLQFDEQGWITPMELEEKWRVNLLHD